SPGRVRAAGPAPGPARPAARPSGTPAAAEEGPQGRQRVVGDLPGPDEVPQGGEELPVGRPGRRRPELVPERGALLLQVHPDGLVEGTVRPLRLLTLEAEQWQLVPEGEAH